MLIHPVVDRLRCLAALGTNAPCHMAAQPLE
jgi:hypothetical protein